jgi:hypothetical protein
VWLSPEAALLAALASASASAAAAAAASSSLSAPPAPLALRVRADAGAPGAAVALVCLLEAASARAALEALRLERTNDTGHSDDDDTGARILAAALRRCPRLGALSSARVSLDARSWTRLCAAAGAAASLREWEAESCGLTGEACLAAAAGALGASRSLRALNLAGNGSLGDAGIGTLCAALRAPGCTLRALVLAACGLGEPSALALAALLASGGTAQKTGKDSQKNNGNATDVGDSSCTLRALDLGRNPALGGRGGAALLDALGVNAHLEALMLDGCGLTAAACARSLAAGIRENGRLRVLDLADNSELGDAVCTPALADALWDNGALTALELSGCGVGDGGAAELGRGLARNGSLRLLGLARSPRLSERGVASLRAAAGRKSLHVRTYEEEEE